jgi:hypothetical protein
VTTQGSEPLFGLNVTLLQIGDFSLPLPGIWTFCLSQEIYEHCFGSELLDVKSMIVSVPMEGNYSIQASSDDISGFFETLTGFPLFEVNSNHTFIENCEFVKIRNPTPTVFFTEPLQYRYRSGKKLILRFELFVFLIGR